MGNRKEGEYMNYDGKNKNFTDNVGAGVSIRH